MVEVGGSVTGFVPNAILLAPPVRTSVGDTVPCDGPHGWSCVTGYESAQQSCVSDAPVCQIDLDPMSDTPAYGRFCGAERPRDADWAQAMTAGPIDVIDAVCMHAKHAGVWYPEPASSACILRHGLGRLIATIDGEVAEPGTSQYEEVLEAMPNLAEAITRYESDAAACSDEALASFEDSLSGAAGVLP